MLYFHLSCWTGYESQAGRGGQQSSTHRLKSVETSASANLPPMQLRVCFICCQCCVSRCQRRNARAMACSRQAVAALLMLLSLRARDLQWRWALSWLVPNWIPRCC